MSHAPPLLGPQNPHLARPMPGSQSLYLAPAQPDFWSPVRVWILELVPLGPVLSQSPAWDLGPVPSPGSQGLVSSPSPQPVPGLHALCMALGAQAQPSLDLGPVPSSASPVPGLALGAHAQPRSGALRPARPRPCPALGAPCPAGLGPWGLCPARPRLCPAPARPVRGPRGRPQPSTCRALASRPAPVRAAVPSPPRPLRTERAAAPRAEAGARGGALRPLKERRRLGKADP